MHGGKTFLGKLKKKEGLAELGKGKDRKENDKEEAKNQCSSTSK